MVDYLILSRAYDSKAMKAFRAMYGYNYVQNGWMGDIYFSGSGELNYLKATVSPSQPGIGRSDYNVWVAITMDCTVLTAHCTCPAGNGRSCSHISALLYAISLAWSSGVGGTTCTDQRQAWGKGASKSLTHEKISDISFKRPRLQMVQENTVVTQSIDNVEREGQFLDHSDLQKYIEESPLKELWNCKDTISLSSVESLWTQQRRTRGNSAWGPQCGRCLWTSYITTSLLLLCTLLQTLHSSSA